MPQKLLKFTLLLLVAGLVSYLFYLNPANVDVHLREGSSWSAPLAFVLILSFASGAIVTALFATVFGFWHLLGDWSNQRAASKLAREQSALLHAREFLAVRNVSEARKALRKVVQSNPKNFQGRSLLIDLEIQSGDVTAARDLLEEARSDLQNSPELTVRSAEVYEALGNLLSAYDSFAALHQRDPENVFALSKMISLLERLERTNEAVAMQEKLVRLLPKSEHAPALKNLARLHLKALAEQKLSATEEKRQLEDLAKRFRSCNKIPLRLAELERESGDLKAASKKLTDAFQNSGDLHPLLMLAKNWLVVSEPEQALKHLRGAIAIKDESLANRGRLVLVATLNSLGMRADAQKELEKISEAEIFSGDEAALKEYLITTLKHGSSDDQIEALNQLICKVSPLLSEVSNLNVANGKITTDSWQQQFLIRERKSPSPTLSTP